MKMMSFRSRLVDFAYRLLFMMQERLYCTRKEALTIAGLSLLIVLAHGMRIIRAHTSPFDDAYYAETDSLFAVLSERARELNAVDTLFTGSPRLSFAQMKSMEEEYAEVGLYIVKDTLELPAVSFPININSAASLELQALPRIGPQMAERIIQFRSLSPFQKTEDLMKVKGIGPKTFEKLATLVTVKDSVSVAELPGDG